NEVLAGLAAQLELDLLLDDRRAVVRVDDAIVDLERHRAPVSGGLGDREGPTIVPDVARIRTTGGRARGPAQAGGRARTNTGRCRPSASGSHATSTRSPTPAPSAPSPTRLLSIRTPSSRSTRATT